MQIENNTNYTKNHQLDETLFQQGFCASHPRILVNEAQ